MATETSTTTTSTIDPDGLCTSCNAYYLECECAWNRPRCRCTHDTSNPERGCECGYADWLCDVGAPDTRPGTVASLALRPNGPDHALDRRLPYRHWCHICQAATHPDDNDRCPACGWDYGDWMTPEERAEHDELGRQMGYGSRRYQGD